MFDTVIESWRFAVSQKIFFLFGILMAFPAITLLTFIQKNNLGTAAQFLAYVLDHPLQCTLFLGGYIFVLLTSKSALISLFHHFFEKKQVRIMVSPSFFMTSFWKALRIDATLFSFFAVILFIISLPPLLSFFMKNSAGESLLLLTELTLVPIIFTGYFIREFTYCYFLLSPLTLKGSFEASSRLFLRNKYICLSFGVTFLFMALLFTFFLNFVMLSIVALLHDTTVFPQASIFFVISLLLVAWYEVWRQSLWFHFFQKLAKPKQPLPDKPPVILEKEVPEMPVA